MKLMKVIRNQLLFTGFVIATGYIAYQVMLDDEAKQQLKQLGVTMNNSYRQLTGIVDQHFGVIMDDDLVSQNRQRIREAWADLGY